ncbi:MAG: hypothetical protein VCD50_09895 [Alphaproteobacteria bacterium]|jgi:hypothetical protein
MKPLPTKTEGFVWREPDGTPVSCMEKLKVLEENLVEIQELCQEALEDAVLMGCDEDQARDVLRALADSLDKPFTD